MTLIGTVNKTAALVLIFLGAATWVWKTYFDSGGLEDIKTYLWIGLAGGFPFAICTILRKRIAPFTAPVFAFFEGLAIGATSAYCESKRPGVALQAVAITVGALVFMLGAYGSRALRVNDSLVAGVVAALGGIVFLYFADVVLRYFGHPVLGHSGLSGAVSAVVLAVAIFTLVLDFNFIAKGIAARSPKYMEWYAAFAIILTLVWMYFEIMRLLGRRR
jgi:uncharacterized YccA/Bax inhibitor family protein